MNVMLDNNVLIDALANREPFCKEAQEILRLVAQEELCGFFSVNSATDIYYILRKVSGADQARKAVAQLLRILFAVSVTSEDCTNALATNIDDFEDALLAVCAEKMQADCIVSRDVEFQHASTLIPVISPSELLKRLKSTT